MQDTRLETHSFIAGTPLHIMISLSLIRQLDIKSVSKLKIVDYFNGAENVYKRMSELNWEYDGLEVSFFPSHRQAYIDSLKDKTDHLYLDSDASFQRYLDLMAITAVRPDINIIVFEDGVGTYRTDLYAGLKKVIFDAVGVGTYLGGHRKTSTVFVFDEQRYRNVFPQVKAEVVQIAERLEDTISRLSVELDYIFGHQIEHSSHHHICNLYLSNWKIDEAAIEMLAELNGDTFVKLHPHIKRSNLHSNIVQIDNRVPAEIVILNLSKNYQEVHVYHHGSSVEQYITSQNVDFINVQRLLVA
tara:strand:+ start:4051 stop:4953 length:903 start_codon:yes stop_codon:yes gene_type:complete